MTGIQIILLLLGVLVVLGIVSVSHHMRRRAAHGRDRETPPAAPDNRPDL